MKIKRKLPATPPPVPPVIAEYNNAKMATTTTKENNSDNKSVKVLPAYQEYLDRFKADATWD